MMKNPLLFGRTSNCLHFFLIALCPLNKDIRVLRDGQGNIKERAYSSHDLQNSTVLKDCKYNVLFAHEINGCNATAAFFGEGKAHTVNLINTRKDLQEVVAVFNNPSSAKDDIVRAGEKFTVALCKATKTSSYHYGLISLNKLADQSSQAVILSRLPPTSAALAQHSYRVFHRIHS